MTERIAVKRLSESDLMFFEPHFRANPVSNQKAINLNADVLATQFFPALAALDRGPNYKFPVDLTVAGPGGTTAAGYRRFVTLSARNWRLETMIEEPAGQQGRFAEIRRGDLAIMKFGGDKVPSSVDVVIVTKSLDEAVFDQVVRQLTANFRRSMVAVTGSELVAWADSAAVGDDHPLRSLADEETIDAAVIEATFGNDAARRRLRKKAGRPMTETDLAAGRAAAEAIGREGEGLAWEHVLAMMAAGTVLEAKWTSKEDAAASWDFDVVLADGTKVRMDAKSTAGPHRNPIHMSGAEIGAAAEIVRYDVIRISEIEPFGAKACIAQSINDLARRIVEKCAELPLGVLPDAFSIASKALSWGAETTVLRSGIPYAAAAAALLSARPEPTDSDSA